LPHDATSFYFATPLAFCDIIIFIIDESTDGFSLAIFAAAKIDCHCRFRHSFDRIFSDLRRLRFHY